MLRTLVLMERGRWREAMTEAEEKEQWGRYLEGVAHAQYGQWGDNFTLMAISGVLKRMVLACSVGPSKGLTKFEIEPPDYWDTGESTGIPLILSHLRDYHYLPVRIRRLGFGRGRGRRGYERDCWWDHGEGGSCRKDRGRVDAGSHFFLPATVEPPATNAESHISSTATVGWPGVSVQRSVPYGDVHFISGFLFQ